MQARAATTFKMYYKLNIGFKLKIHLKIRITPRRRTPGPTTTSYYKGSENPTGRYLHVGITARGKPVCASKGRPHE